MRLLVFFLLRKSINDLLTSKSSTTLNLYFNKKKRSKYETDKTTGKDSYIL